MSKIPAGETLESMANMLKYFHEEKGDITCYCHVNAALKAFPEVKRAYKKLLRAEKNMQRELQDAVNEAEIQELGL